MKVYAYLRVSTDHQTLAQQTNAINDYIRVKSLLVMKQTLRKSNCVRDG